jgi:PleD family two-component response regulator
MTALAIMPVTCLKGIAETINKRIRKNRLPGPLGRGGIVILLPDTPVDKAAVLAEELRESISKMDIPVWTELLPARSGRLLSGGYG